MSSSKPPTFVTRASDGYVNLDVLLQSMGKTPEDFRAIMAKPKMKAMIKQLSKDTGIPVSELIKVEGRKGNTP